MRTECRCGLPGGVVPTFRDNRLHPVGPPVGLLAEAFPTAGGVARR